LGIRKPLRCFSRSNPYLY